MAFIQVIEYETSRFDEMQQAADSYRAQTEGKRTVTRVLVCKDRERDNHYVTIVEFPSYEDAMRNSALPETTALAEQMAKLADGPPKFWNLDVITEET